MPEAASAVSDNRAPSLLEASIVTPLQALMSAKAGVLRSGDGLAEALAGLAALGREETDKPDAEAWQATNLHLIATALVSAALARQETRGSHWREEFGEPDDAWRGHLVLSLGTVGPEWAFEPVWNE
jgi:L-aspartate oxidase